ncbi:MAG: hypothetical protein ACREOC_18695 [Gemmatimonadales bacterium]
MCAMRRRTVLPLVPFVFLVLLPGLAAQAPPPESEAPRRPARLFRDEAPLSVTIAADFREIFRDRDTMKVRRDSATITFPGETGPVTLPVQLSTRGHFRLRSSTCESPPIRVFFDKESVKKTLFGGDASLKLVTHCGKAERYEQNLLLEHGIYRAYNRLTELSHRSRLARVTYADTKDPARTVTRYGFFLEDDDDMARRNGGQVLRIVGGGLDEMDPAQLDLVTVFQYLIGNTDWSVIMIHNIRLVQVEGHPSFLPVAYDFDWSGVVNATYARPDARLGTKTVRERVYRGACRPMEELKPALARVMERRDSIRDAFASIPDLEPKRLEDVLRYLDEGFRMIDRPEEFKHEQDRACSRG